MSLIDTINSDIAKITSNNKEFGVSIELIAPTLETITINGIHTKHHLGIDTDGNMVNSKKASIAFSESLLIAPYPVRNTNKEVDLLNHLINVKDSTGIVKNYIVQQWFPDETIGLIVCILEDYDNN